MQVRTELGLAPNAPWVATAIPVPVNEMHAGPSHGIDPFGMMALRCVANELRWLVPEIQFGVLFVQLGDSRAPLSNMSPPFDFGRIASDAATLWDWMCGADVWVLTDPSPLSEAIQQVAPSVRLPSFGLETSPELAPVQPLVTRRWHSDPIALATQIANCMQNLDAGRTEAWRQVTHAHREMDGAILTIEHAHQRLHRALEDCAECARAEGSSPPVRRAA